MKYFSFILVIAFCSCESEKTYECTFQEKCSRIEIIYTPSYDIISSKRICTTNFTSSTLKNTSCKNVLVNYSNAIQFESESFRTNYDTLKYRLEINESFYDKKTIRYTKKKHEADKHAEELTATGYTCNQK